MDSNEPLLHATKLEETKLKVTALYKASIFSHMTFRWRNPFLNLGYSKPLETRDIPHLVPEDVASTTRRAFVEAWEHQRKKGPLNRPADFRALSKCYWKDMVVTRFFAFLRSIAMILGPLFLRSFVQFAGAKKSFRYEGLILVGGFFLVKILESFSQRLRYFNSTRSIMRMHSALIAVMDQKQL